LLRVEDTDQKRTVPGAEDRLYRDLRWAGLEWDEGPTVGGPYGPYKQSERTEIYRSHVRPLVESKKAYRCFCSSERIDKLNRSRHERGLPLGYDRHCTDMPYAEAEDRAHQGQSHVIRFRVPKEYPRFTDLVYGKTGQGNDKGRKLHVDQPVYDDPILIKSDGYPTYHFANIVDDHLMEITHVVRGSEWMSSTPLHVALYDAFHWTPPSFAHVPLLVDKNGQKLSKRNFDSDIASFRDRGIFPDALANFAALLGWSHQQKSDIMNLQELENLFDLKITKGNTIVAFDKLWFLQEQHALRRVVAGEEDFEQMIRDTAVALLEQYGAARVSTFIGQRKLKEVVASLLRAKSLPYRSAPEYAAQCAVFLNAPPARPPYQPSDIKVLPSLRVAAATLCLPPDANWTADVHRSNMGSLQPGLSDERDLKAEKAWRRELYHYLRWALLGGAAGPGLPETMEILGRATCLERIHSAAQELRSFEAVTTRPDIQVATASR